MLVYCFSSNQGAVKSSYDWKFLSVKYYKEGIHIFYQKIKIEQWSVNTIISIQFVIDSYLDDVSS